MRGNTEALAHVEEWDHHVVVAEEIKDLNDIYNWLANGQPEKGPLHDMFPDVKFNSVALDAITEYHRIALDSITGTDIKKIGDRTVNPQWEHWGELLRQTVYMVSKYYELARDNKVHVFLTVHSKEERDEVSGAIKNRPQLWGQSSEQVPAFALCHMYLMQARRLTAGTRKRLNVDEDYRTRVGFFYTPFDTMAKDQYGVLGEYMENPTVPKFIEAIYREEEKKKKKKKTA